jgi:hypothetical protein
MQQLRCFVTARSNSGFRATLIKSFHPLSAAISESSRDFDSLQVMRLLLTEFPWKTEWNPEIVTPTWIDHRTQDDAQSVFARQ